MALADALLTFGVLFGLFVLGYCKYMNKTNPALKLLKFPVLINNKAIAIGIKILNIKSTPPKKAIIPFNNLFIVYLKPLLLVI